MLTKSAFIWLKYGKNGNIMNTILQFKITNKIFDLNIF